MASKWIALSNTTLQDLLDALETASGRDLTAWTQQWIQTAGVNTLAPELEVDASGNLTAFSIVQSAVAEWPTIRPHRLAVGFYNLDSAGKLVRVHREEPRQRHQRRQDVVVRGAL